jgi:hypothetical protein
MFIARQYTIIRFDNVVPGNGSQTAHDAVFAPAEPVHNRQGGRFGDLVEQYLQYRDDQNLGPEIPDMIHDLWRASQASK